MKKNTFLFLLLFSLPISGFTQVPSSSSSLQNGFEDQIDQTDIYAIPLDSSEEEEEEELNALEKQRK